LVLRSDDRGMSHAAHGGHERQFGAGLALLPVQPPAALRFRAGALQSASSRSRTTLSNTTNGSIALIGRAQPRFELMVIHIGSDDQELGALGEGFAGDVLPTGGRRPHGHRAVPRGRHGSRRSAPAVYRS
jgi:hypothetical protein